MLDPKQYELIGQITIGFNEIDFLMEIYTNEFLCTRDPEMAEVISFRKRKELFDGVLKALAAEYPELENPITSVRSLAKEAEELSKERNSLVHGVIVDKLGRFVLRSRRAYYPRCDEAGLTDLLKRLSATEERLTFRCDDLLEALKAKRGPSPAL